MSLLEVVNVAYKADIKQYEKSMNRAKKLLDGFFMDAAKYAAGNILANVFQAGVQGLVSFAKEALNSIGAANDLSSSLGTTVQALRELQFAGKLVGADAQTVQGALSKMTQLIGEAFQGSETAAAGFENLGLSIQELNAGDAYENFRKVQEAIRNLPTPAMKAAAAVDAFGKAGVKMLPLINSDLDKARENFKLIAGEVSDIDVASIDSAGDAVDKLWTMAEGLGVSIAAGIAPYASQLIEDFIEWGRVGEQSGGAVAQGVDQAKESALTFNNVIDESKVFLLGIKTAIEVVVYAFGFAASFMVSAVESVINSMKRLVAKIPGASELFGDWLDEDTTAWNAAMGFADAAKESVDEYTRATRQLEENTGKTNALSDFFERAETNARKAGKEMREYRELMREASKAAQMKDREEAKQKKADDKQVDDLLKMADGIRDRIKTPFEKFQDSVKELVALRNVGLLSPEELSRAAEMFGKTATDALGKDKKSVGTFESVGALVSVQGLAGSTRKVEVSDPQLKQVNATLLRLLAANEKDSAIVLG